MTFGYSGKADETLKSWSPKLRGLVSRIDALEKFNAGFNGAPRVEGPTADQTLVYSPEAGLWINQDLAAGVSTLDDLIDVTITTPADNEVLAYDSGGDFINQTAAEAGLATATHTHVEADITDLAHTTAAGDIVSGTFADARIAESNVTQHEAALTITESQISDLNHTVTFTATDFTASANPSANTGTWTPTVNYYRYFKLGDFVWVSVSTSAATLTGANSNYMIMDLPFDARATASSAYAGGCWLEENGADAHGRCRVVSTGSGTVRFYRPDNVAFTQNDSIRIRANFMYETV